ncbi:MAG: hypothetical protein WBC05_01210 [Sedimentisphaerales bacterium]
MLYRRALDRNGLICRDICGGGLEAAGPANSATVPTKNSRLDISHMDQLLPEYIASVPVQSVRVRADAVIRRFSPAITAAAARRATTAFDNCKRTWMNRQAQGPSRRR